MKNNQVWLDTSGRAINAHGGGMLFYNNRFYWYGENKTAGWEGRLAFDGVHCYTSSNLVDWTDCGVVLDVVDDPASPIVRGCRIERPKVIYNPATKKFVMYFHSSDANHTIAKRGLAVSDSPTGKFTFLGVSRANAGFAPVNMTAAEAAFDTTLIPPERSLPTGDSDEVRKYPVFRRDQMAGQMARDMNLFVDVDGKAYHLFSSEQNSTMHFAELSDDFLNWTGRYARILPYGWNEGMALFRRNNLYYLLMSGCTGWDPNAARSASASHIFGPWTTHGNPCRGPNAELTFGCQSTAVFEYDGKHIAMFDHWHPKSFDQSGYTWLPVKFGDDGTYTFDWQDEFFP